MNSLPFAWEVAQRQLPMLHADLDYPVRQVVIDGELWMIFVPGRSAYGGKCPVMRFKGEDQFTLMDANTTSKAGQSVQFTFRGADIYWRAAVSICLHQDRLGPKAPPHHQNRDPWR